MSQNDQENGSGEPNKEKDLATVLDNLHGRARKNPQAEKSATMGGKLFEESQGNINRIAYQKQKRQEEKTRMAAMAGRMLKSKFNDVGPRIEKPGPGTRIQNFLDQNAELADDNHTPMDIEGKEAQDEDKKPGEGEDGESCDDDDDEHLDDDSEFYDENIALAAQEQAVVEDDDGSDDFEPVVASSSGVARDGLEGPAGTLDDSVLGLGGDSAGVIKVVVPREDEEDENDGQDSEEEGEESTKRKQVRASAEDRIRAGIVHKTHLLCLLSRGIACDRACDSLNVHAALLSGIPEKYTSFGKKEISLEKVKSLASWYSHWYQGGKNAHAPYWKEGPFVKHNDLARQEDVLLQAARERSGAPLDGVMLFVSICRALAISCRLVFIFDPLSIKPDRSVVEERIRREEGNSAEVGRTAWAAGVSVAVTNNAKDSGLDKEVKISEKSDKASGTGGVSKGIKGRKSKSEAATEDEKEVITPQKEPEKASGKRKRGKKKVSVEEIDLTLEDEDDCMIVDSTPSKGKRKDREKRPQKSSSSKKARTSIEVFDLEEEETPRAEKTDTKGKAKAASKRGRGIVVRDEDEAPKRRQSIKDGASGTSGKKKDSDIDKNDGRWHFDSCTEDEDDGGLSLLKPFQKPSPTAPPKPVRPKVGGAFSAMAEVYCDDQQRWIYVNCFSGTVDKPHEVEKKNKPVAYAIAYDTKIKDVTRRYAQKCSLLADLRPRDDWFSTTLEKVNDEAWAMSVQQPRRVEQSRYGPEDLEERDKREDQELESRSLSEAMPTRIDAFKKHPLYCIEKHCTKYEMIHPKTTILGYVSGNPVYPRSHMQTLHTKDRWLREGRVVIPAAEPVKSVKASAVANTSAEKTPLFGYWQTYPYQPPTAKDGIVPKNDRGNVYAFTRKTIPIGCVHIRKRGLVTLCRQLGIDFAMAMTGFEIKGGKSIPVMDGVIVCTEYQETLLAAHEQAEIIRAEKAEKRRQAELVSRWKKVLNRVKARIAVENMYGSFTNKNVATPPPPSNNTSAADQTAGNAGGIVSAVRAAEHGGPQSVHVGGSRHVHRYSDEDRWYVEEEDEWYKKCVECGLTVAFIP